MVEDRADGRAAARRNAAAPLDDLRLGGPLLDADRSLGEHDLPPGATGGVVHDGTDTRSLDLKIASDATGGTGRAYVAARSRRLRHRTAARAPLAS